MTQTLKKKLAGTAVFALVLGGVMAASFGYVDARFNLTGNNLKFDAEIIEINEESLVVDTNGTELVTVEFNDSTRFRPGRSGVEDLNEGDMVYIQSKIQNDGSIIAWHVLSREVSHSYGNNPRIRTIDGEIVAKDDDTVTVELEDADLTMTFTVNDDTKIKNSDFAGLDIGEEIKVQGQDTGSEFLAKKIWATSEES